MIYDVASLEPKNEVSFERCLRDDLYRLGLVFARIALRMCYFSGLCRGCQYFRKRFARRMKE